MAAKFPMPLVVVSSCLLGKKCRYDGTVLKDASIDELRPFVRFNGVCPETEIGLACPRPHIRIVATNTTTRLVQPDTGRDLTIKMAHFSRKHLHSLDHVDGFILKSRSPTCALSDSKLFPDRKSKDSNGHGAGIFARRVMQQFAHCPIEDEYGLTKPAVRRRFLIRIFASAALHRATRGGSLKKLARFHEEAAPFQRAFNGPGARRLQAIMRNKADKPPAEVMGAYRKEFIGGLAKFPAKGPLFPKAPTIVAPKAASPTRARRRRK